MVKLNNTVMYSDDILVTTIILEDEDGNEFTVKAAIDLSEVVFANKIDLSDDYPNVTEVFLRTGDSMNINADIDSFIKKWTEYKKKSSFLFGVN